MKNTPLIIVYGALGCIAVAYGDLVFGAILILIANLWGISGRHEK